MKTAAPKKSDPPPEKKKKAESCVTGFVFNSYVILKQTWYSNNKIYIDMFSIYLKHFCDNPGMSNGHWNLIGVEIW